MQKEEHLPPQARRYHVVVVDDNADFRELVVAALAAGSAPVRVTPFASGTEALAALPAGPAPDLYVIDFHMPPPHGPALVQALRRSGVCSRVLVMSAAMTAQGRRQCLALGADSALSKPGSLAAVSEVIRAALAMGPRSCPPAAPEDPPSPVNAA